VAAHRRAAAFKLTFAMSTLRFKTTINCGGCIKAVTPALNREVGPNNWAVDTANPDKILTVKNTPATPAQVVKAVEDAGFEIQALAS
jgi:copper chaperone CopZ